MIENDNCSSSLIHATTFAPSLPKGYWLFNCFLKLIDTNKPCTHFVKFLKELALYFVSGLCRNQQEAVKDNTTV